MASLKRARDSLDAGQNHDFHDRKVMASLKPNELRRRTIYYLHFHDRKVMASLKRNDAGELGTP